MYLDKMTGALEAVLFAAGEPVSVAELADLLQLEKPQVWELVSGLGTQKGSKADECVFGNLGDCRF